MKHLEIALICSEIPFLILSFFMDESPRWLLTQGEIEKAKNVIRKILKMNKKPASNIKMIQPIDSKVI